MKLGCDIVKANAMVVILSMLLISSATISAMNVKTYDNGPPEALSLANEEIDILMGEIYVDCDYDDDLAVDIEMEDSPYQMINPQNSEIVTLNFYIKWHIRDQQMLNFAEKWEFELTLRNGNSPSDPVLDTNKKVVWDGLFGPGEYDGNLFVEGVSLDRTDFDKDGFFNKPELRKFRLEARGAYYHDTGSKVIDDDDLWSVIRIDLDNQDPTKPTLTSDDISDGGKGNMDNTYTFTASGSTDPDGDSISYVFAFHDGTVITDSSGTESHKYDGEQGEYSVSAYAVDRFGAQSDGVHWTFTLTKSKSFMTPMFLELTKQFPKLVWLLESSIFSAFL
jgi:hypothetical protein